VANERRRFQTGLNGETTVTLGNHFATRAGFPTIGRGKVVKTEFKTWKRTGDATSSTKKNTKNPKNPQTNKKNTRPKPTPCRTTKQNIYIVQGKGTNLTNGKKKRNCTGKDELGAKAGSG